MTELALSNMVVLLAKSGHELEVEAALMRLTLVFRGQEGCVQYDCYQSFEAKSRFMLVMQWNDETTLAGHFASEPARELFEEVATRWLEEFSEAEYRAFSHSAVEFDEIDPQ